MQEYQKEDRIQTLFFCIFFFNLINFFFFAVFVTQILFASQGTKAVTPYFQIPVKFLFVAPVSPLSSLVQMSEAKWNSTNLLSFSEAVFII